MAAISRFFYVRPWELERLTVWEFYHFCTQVDGIVNG